MRLEAASRRGSVSRHHITGLMPTQLGHFGGGLQFTALTNTDKQNSTGNTQTNTTQKANNTKYNKTKLQSPLSTLGHETRWAPEPTRGNYEAISNYAGKEPEQERKIFLTLQT